MLNSSQGRSLFNNGSAVRSRTVNTGGFPLSAGVAPCNESGIDDTSKRKRVRLMRIDLASSQSTILALISEMGNQCRFRQA